MSQYVRIGVWHRVSPDDATITACPRGWDVQARDARDSSEYLPDRADRCSECFALEELAEAPIRDFIATLRCLLDGTRATKTRLAYAARTLHPGGGPLSYWLTLALLDRLEEISR